jgi:hypothetical protein
MGEKYICKFRRGDKVNYRPKENSETWSNGNKKFKPVDGTYIWTWFGHLSLDGYVIQHKDGFPRAYFIKDYLEGNFPDGFEAVHSSELKDGLKYIWASEDELVLVKAKDEAPHPVTANDIKGSEIPSEQTKEQFEARDKELKKSLSDMGMKAIGKVLAKENFNRILPMCLGCEADAVTRDGVEVYLQWMTISDLYALEKGNFKSITPRLRPLWDMSDGEVIGAYTFEFGKTPKEAGCDIQTAKEYFELPDCWTIETHHYLLQQGFDLFGLVESGYATTICKTPVE